MPIWNGRSAVAPAPWRLSSPPPSSPARNESVIITSESSTSTAAIARRVTAALARDGDFAAAARWTDEPRTARRTVRFRGTTKADRLLHKPASGTLAGLGVAARRSRPHAGERGLPRARTRSRGRGTVIGD